MVDAASPGVRGSRLRQFAMFGLKRSQRFRAALARINVEREKPGFPACRKADVCVYPGVTPPPDVHLISLSVMRPVSRAWMFADAITNRLMAQVVATVLASVLVTAPPAKARRLR